MPETPRTWWFDPVPVLKRQALALIVSAAGLFAVFRWEESPWWLFLMLMGAVWPLMHWAGDMPPRLACLMSGGLVVVGADTDVISIPLAVARIQETAKGTQITWEEDESAPTSVPLPGFADTEQVTAAIEAARETGAPRTTRSMAARLPLAPVLTPWRWMSKAWYGLLLVPIFALLFQFTDLPFYALPLVVAALPWLELPRSKQPWAALTPAGLWLLRNGQATLLIPAAAITGARPYLWADCTVTTTDPEHPTLKLGILPDDLRRILSPGGASHV